MAFATLTQPVNKNLEIMSPMTLNQPVMENLGIRIKIFDSLFIDETRTKITKNSQSMRVKRNKPHKCIDHQNSL